MILLFSGAVLLEFRKNCPYDFDRLLHVPSNDNWISGLTKFMPKVTPGVRHIAPKGGESDVFLLYLFLAFFSVGKLP